MKHGMPVLLRRVFGVSDFRLEWDDGRRDLRRDVPVVDVGHEALTLTPKEKSLPIFTPYDIVL